MTSSNSRDSGIAIPDYNHTVASVNPDNMTEFAIEGDEHIWRKPYFNAGPNSAHWCAKQHLPTYSTAVDDPAGHPVWCLAPIGLLEAVAWAVSKAGIENVIGMLNSFEDINDAELSFTVTPHPKKFPFKKEQVDDNAD